MSKFLKRKFSESGMCTKKQSKTPIKSKENQAGKLSTTVRKPEIETQSLNLQSPNSYFKFHVLESLLQTETCSVSEGQVIDHVITNKEVSQFLKRHFLYSGGGSQQSNRQSKALCESLERIPLTYFMKQLLLEYPDVIEEHNLNETLTLKLKQRIRDLISEDGVCVSLVKLQLHTKSLGLIGLLLVALKEITETSVSVISQSHHITSVSSFDSRPLSPIFNNQYLTENINALFTRLEVELQQKYQVQQRKLEQQYEQVQRIWKQIQSSDTMALTLKTKNIIMNLNQQLKAKDAIIQDLEQKLKYNPKNSQHSITMSPQLSPVKQIGQTASPFFDNCTANQKLFSEVLNAWDAQCSHEDYKLAQIVLSDDNQISFDKFQMIPLIKKIPGFTELSRLQSCSNIITHWLQHSINKENHSLTDLYQSIIMLLPTLRTTDNTQYLIQVFQLLLKLTSCILIIKDNFNQRELTEYAQSNLQVQNVVNSIIFIHKFAIKSNKTQYTDQLLNDNLLKKVQNILHTHQQTNSDRLLTIINALLKIYVRDDL